MCDLWCPFCWRTCVTYSRPLACPYVIYLAALALFWAPFMRPMCDLRPLMQPMRGIACAPFHDLFVALGAGFCDRFVASLG